MSDEEVKPSRNGPNTATAIGLVAKQTVEVGPRWAVIGIFFILLFGALYLTASFVLPVIVALLFALIMSPIVRFLRRRLRIWEPVSAFILVIGSLMVMTFGFYMLSNPIANIITNAPTYVTAVDREIRSIQARFQRLQEAGESVGEDAEAGEGENAADALPPSPFTRPAPEDGPQEVVVQNPGLIDSATNELPTLLASILFSLVFLFFLLASGDMFYSKLVRLMPTLSDKKRALHIAHDIERELSRYFLTITLINTGLGIAVGVGLWYVGMDSPVVFGALATLLNFIPYLGSLFGMALVGVIALADFGSVGDASVPVLIYLACTTIEGQFVTPLVVGRRLQMNAAAVFLSVAFWGWIWGVMGMFLAVPLMVTIKVFATYISALAPFGAFLSGDEIRTEDEE
ncbi:AI-2E family transporter [Fulvimarina sp. 2208YS6-2-32]|uniref:AI-2E family transporter n=1 Tax=Fulvimarina uroteuthidis TaxID=3098149 RepID=A0ABU5HXM2_9HYPH|nr:AI-2E family transporter [Fulvimarina sp. 2208YS6-2-32]MDY8107795.1 AI-2E family transporter [Fulvimarina sp. 2208YS6-2-32]